MESENSRSDWLRFLLVFSSTAILVWFGNRLTPWWPLMWFAPLPVLWYSLHTSWGRAACAAIAGWLVGSLNLLHYFHQLGIPFLGWLADFGGMALLFAAGVLLFRAQVRKGAIWSGIAVLPALWVSADWLRNWTTPHGTSADLAYTQLSFLPFLQLASLTGPWGMSFLLLLAPAALAAFLFLRKREPRRATRMAWVLAGGYLAVLGFGVGRLATTGQRRFVKVGLIVSDSPKNDVIVSKGADAARLLAAYRAQATLLAAQEARVIVMPEKIAAVSAKYQAADEAIFQSLANATGSTIVAGELYLSTSDREVRRYNRAEVYSPDGVAASYDKQHILPPFESNLTPGTARLTLSRGNCIWGVAICKDMDFTSTGRDYGRLHAGLMLVPAWDFNLDRTWHGHMAIMRGVEGGFSVVRAAKNGYLTVSDDRGRILAETRSDVRPFTTLLAVVPVGHQWTLFQAWGDWFAWLAVALLGLVLVRLAIPRKPSSTP